MTSFKSLLAATDFSDAGNNAVRRAMLLAHDHGAQLHIVHVLKATGSTSFRDWLSPQIGIDLQAAHARHALQQVAMAITGAYDVVPTIEVVVGDPCQSLLQASEHADLVVLGRRGRSRLSGLLVGRTADRLLRACERPILSVRAPVERPYQRVLVPIDFSASSDAAIRVAARIRREVSMQVFHVINSRHDAVLRSADVPEHIITETRLMEEAGTNARMRRKVAGLGLDCTPLSFALAYGPAVRSTLDHARQHGADLIVTGKQARSTMCGFLRASVGRRVLSGAACAMLIAPALGGSAAGHAAATATAEPERGAEVHLDNAAISQRAAAHAAASARAHWIHNTARFVSRRAS